MGNAVRRACGGVLVRSRCAVLLALGSREVHYRRERGRAVAPGQGPACRSSADMAVAATSMPGQAGCMYTGGDGVRVAEEGEAEKHPGELMADVSWFKVDGCRIDIGHWDTRLGQSGSTTPCDKRPRWRRMAAFARGRVGRWLHGGADRLRAGVAVADGLLLFSWRRRTKDDEVGRARFVLVHTFTVRGIHSRFISLSLHCGAFPNGAWTYR
jgi:hypothetical protein